MHSHRLLYGSILLFIALFPSCTPQKQNADHATSPSWITYQDPTNSFTFEYPMQLKYEIRRPDRSLVLTTNSAPVVQHSSKDYFISISDSVSCKQMGVTKPEQINHTNALILQGKVDYFDNSGYIYEGSSTNTIVCRPPLLQYKEDGTPEGSNSAYALCSEKDGKTVLICISQLTDNPQLAEEIFKTFRWK